MTGLNAIEKPKPIRVLVVDDSAAQRGLLMAFLDADPEIEVVGWAADGAEAIRVAARLKPDVITMDLRMPGVDGLEATRRILQETPIPIVMVTASVVREDQHMAFDAFQAGALAMVAKPPPGPTGRRAVQELLQTIKIMARVKVIRRWAPERLRPPVAGPVPSAAKLPARPLEIVAIGASTGGPQALQEIVTRLPATFPLPILVVQHIAPGFAAGLIDWLKPQCALPIQLAIAGLPVSRAGVSIAPSGQHLIVRQRRLALTDDPPISWHRPSATALFQSVAREYGPCAIGVLLTGMGDDGAAGLRDLKRAGGVTIAQDEASSVVFGMPAVAIGLGIVDHILPPAEIAPQLVELARLGHGG